MLFLLAHSCFYSYFKAHKHFIPFDAYGSTPGYFWGIPSKSEETFDIIFRVPIEISRIAIFSGLPNSSENSDVIQNGVLEVGEGFVPQISDSHHQPFCNSSRVLEKFKNGALDISPSLKLKNIECLRIRLKTENKKWIIIREIEVFQ